MEVIQLSPGWIILNIWTLLYVEEKEREGTILNLALAVKNK